MDACSFLLDRAGTVGLFRKPGSLPRIKTLRVRCGIPGVSDCTDRCRHNSEVLMGSLKSLNRFFLNIDKDDCDLQDAFISSSFKQQAFA